MKRPLRKSTLTRLRARGFTLIELMVALSAGLFLSIFVFMLTRDVSRFFQSEGRLSDATMGAVIGFERLKADIARAGFLASPNLRRDPSRCPRPATPLVGEGWASVPALAEMGLLYIYQGQGGNSLGASSDILTLNGLTPDRLRLFGNYQTADQFPAVTVVRGGQDVTVNLAPRSGAMIRLGYVPGSATAESVIAAAFPVGRALRLVNAEREETYSLIKAVALNGDNPQITLDHATLTVQYEDANGLCGIRGFGADVFVNVVNIIDYRLDDVVRNSAAYQDLRSTVGEGVDDQASTDDTNRTDLVREEIDPRTGVAFVDSAQIVAEYAVDLRFGLTAVTNAAALTLTRYPENAAAITTDFATPLAAPQPNQGPHYIRAIRPRLSVRSRTADRGGDIVGATGLYRVQLRADGPFARVRSLSTTIATRNAQGALWQ